MNFVIKDYKINSNTKKNIPEPTYIPTNAKFNLNDINSNMKLIRINKEQYLLGLPNDTNKTRNLYKYNNNSLQLVGVITGFKYNKDQKKLASGKLYKLNL